MKLFMDRTYYPDGGYGEPIGYENMATRDLVEALYIIERTFGIDYTTTTNLKDLWRYPLHGAFSDSRMPGYGDTGKISGWGWTGLPFLWLSYRTQNPFTAYYTQPYMDQGRGGLWKFLWYTKGLPVKSRRNWCHRTFPFKGTMFLRSAGRTGSSWYSRRPQFIPLPHRPGPHILLTNAGALSEASLEAFKATRILRQPFYPCYNTRRWDTTDARDGDPKANSRQTPAASRRFLTGAHHHHSPDGRPTRLRAIYLVYKGKLEKYTRCLFVKPEIYFSTTA